MNKDEEILKSLVAGGSIGAGLGALILKGNNEASTLGALASAALLATFNASEKAAQTNIPMYVEEDGNLYKIQGGAPKIFIRKIEKSKLGLPQNFKLK